MNKKPATIQFNAPNCLWEMVNDNMEVIASHTSKRQLKAIYSREFQWIFELR